MCRREVMDDFLRKRAEGLGAKLVNGLLLRMEQPEGPQGPIKIHYNDYAAGDGKVGKPSSMEVDMVSSDSFVFFPSELVVRESVQGEAVSTFPKTLTFSSPPLRFTLIRLSAPTAPTPASPRRSTPASTTTRSRSRSASGSRTTRWRTTPTSRKCTSATMCPPTSTGGCSPSTTTSLSVSSSSVRCFPFGEFRG